MLTFTFYQSGTRLQMSCRTCHLTAIPSLFPSFLCTTSHSYHNLLLKEEEERWERLKRRGGGGGGEEEEKEQLTDGPSTANWRGG